MMGARCCLSSLKPKAWKAHTHNSAGQEIGTPGLGLSPPVADGLRPLGTQGHEGLALMTQACQHFRSSTGHSVSLEKQQLLF